MDPVTAASLASTGFTAALKSWGAYALVLMPLGAWLWSLIQDNRSLRAEVSKLNELRVQDAQTMRRVVESGTSTIAARSEAQDRFVEAITAMARKIEALDRKVGPKTLPAPRQKRSP